MIRHEELTVHATRNEQYQKYKEKLRKITQTITR